MLRRCRAYHRRASRERRQFHNPKPQPTIVRDWMPGFASRPHEHPNQQRTRRRPRPDRLLVTSGSLQMPCFAGGAPCLALLGLPACPSRIPRPVLIWPPSERLVRQPRALSLRSAGNRVRVTCRGNPQPRFYGIHIGKRYRWSPCT